MRLILLMLASLAPLALAQGSDPVVAKVGKVSLTRSYFDLQWEYFTHQTLTRQGIPYTPEAAETLNSFKPRLLERIAKDQAVLNVAERQGYAATDAAIEQQISSVRERFESEEAFLAGLKEAGLRDVAGYRLLVYEAITFNAFIDDLVGKIQFSTPALKLLYYLNRAEYSQPARYCSSHILVETQAQAQAVLARLAKGETFETLASELSLDPGSRSEGGNLGCYPVGSLIEAFERAMLRLKVGEITRIPVKTEFGYHIIRLNNIEPLAYVPFEAVQESLSSDLIGAVLDKLIDNYARLEGVQLFPENL
ncbi:peptidylprolyl isomerase [Calidithermus roseus]|uniref:Putative peptidyl-prolyl cis-trans isomerase Cbf2 n=1 Tax=Calidithermus roseus TaxID=1644118 RepID=A0A399ER68_9DEIN|nr:peptidylprolyl isomerase [Calidithermus roseus]RIH86458.1 putative peptidyl-prolyl cis-trans isomerase Cbf2 [Calidithermus roseus]